MPIYEYRCVSCDTVFEELTSSAEEAAIVCPECGSSAKERLMSTPGGFLQGRTKSSPCPSAATCPSAGTCCSGNGSCGL